MTFSKSFEEKYQSVLALLMEIPDAAKRVQAGNLIKLLCDVAFAEGQMSVLKQAQDMINQWPVNVAATKGERK